MKLRLKISVASNGALSCDLAGTEVVSRRWRREAKVSKSVTVLEAGVGGV